MVSRTQNSRVTLAITAAIVPLLGVTAWGWDAREVLLLYWAENLVVGAWGLVKIITMMPRDARPIEHLGKLFVVPFFALHFGGFCAGHAMIIHGLTRHNDDANQMMEAGFVDFGVFSFLTMLVLAIKISIQVIPPAAFLAVAAMAVSHGVETWRTYYANDKWRAPKEDIGDPMLEPYKHVLLTHLALLVGGAFAMWVNHPAPILAVMILGKLAIDWRKIRGGNSRTSPQN